MPTLCPSTQPSSHIIGVVVNGIEEVAGGVDQVIVVETIDLVVGLVGSWLGCEQEWRGSSESLLFSIASFVALL